MVGVAELESATSTMIGEDPRNANNQKLAAYNEFLRIVQKSADTRLRV